MGTEHDPEPERTRAEETPKQRKPDPAPRTGSISNQELRAAGQRRRDAEQKLQRHQEEASKKAGR